MEFKFLKNKKILLLGLGLTNFETANVLKKYIDNITLITNENKSDYYKILNESGYEIILEDNFINDNFDYDLILKSPGIPFNHKILMDNKDVPVINDIELAYLYIKEKKLDTKIIAITGTNGKTSTTLFLESFLSKSNYVALSGGNIGISPLTLLNENEKIDYLLLELSSFQLHSINKFKANYSFILNITPDHLNMHKSFEEYVRCKKNILKNQTKKEYFFLKEKVYDKYFSKEVISPKVVLNRVAQEVKDKIMLYQFYGINFDNLLLCYNLGKILKIEDRIFFETLNSFEGLEHRVEFVEEVAGIKYYNDSKATNLEAMKESVSKLNNIILIVGGISKGDDLSKFDDYLNNVKKVIAFGENKDEFNSEKIIKKVSTLEEAMRIATSEAIEGDSVLLSPASASFDQYQNYQVRGLHFKNLVKEIK